MAKSKTKFARKTRLKNEYEYAEDLKFELEKEKRDLKKNGDPKKTDTNETNKFFKKLFNKNKEPESEIDKRLSSLQEYQGWLYDWIRNPQEGTYK